MLLPSTKKASLLLYTCLLSVFFAFLDHIVCDSVSQSEIVVPVFDAENKLVAVLDMVRVCLWASFLGGGFHCR